MTKGDERPVNRHPAVNPGPALAIGNFRPTVVRVPGRAAEMPDRRELATGSGAESWDVVPMPPVPGRTTRENRSRSWRWTNPSVRPNRLPGAPRKACQALWSSGSRGRLASGGCPNCRPGRGGGHRAPAGKRAASLEPANHAAALSRAGRLPAHPPRAAKRRRGPLIVCIIDHRQRPVGFSFNCGVATPQLLQPCLNSSALDQGARVNCRKKARALLEFDWRPGLTLLTTSISAANCSSRPSNANPFKN